MLTSDHKCNLKGREKKNKCKILFGFSYQNLLCRTKVAKVNTCLCIKLDSSSSSSSAALSLIRSITYFVSNSFLISAKWKNFKLLSTFPPHVQSSQDAPFGHLGCDTDVLCSYYKLFKANAK